MRAIRIGLVIVGSAMLATFMAGSASAHARYKSSTPTAGEVVQTSPAKVDVFFTQNVQKISGTYGLDVEKDGGASVTSGPTVIDEADRSHMSVPLQANLAAGRYVVNWKNVSDEDGDPANGAFSFYIKMQPTAADRQEDQELAAIGAEDITETAGTSTASGTATPIATGAAATPTFAISNTSSDSGSDTKRNVIVIIVAVIAIVAIGGGVAYAIRERMRP